MSSAENKLIPIVKNYIDITWTDSDTDSKVAGIVREGIAKVKRLTNCTEEELIADEERTALVKEYSRLAWAGVPEKFVEFYKSDMIRLRLGTFEEEFTDAD